MYYCDLCGKIIADKTSYHRKCLRELFGIDYFPEIDFTLSEISLKAQEMAGKLSISGVQPKLSMKLNRVKKKLEVVAQGGEYILKPQTGTFPNIPQNENLCMNIALNIGIEVPLHSLIPLQDNSWAYIVKRFDRVKGEKLHQEDFCQILGVEDRYDGSLEQIGKKLIGISEVPGLDIQLFFERILYFFIIGNGDAHLKNFSIIYDEMGHTRLAPAYDIVSSKLVIPDEEDFALPMNGKKNKITGKDFEQFAQILKIRSKPCYKRISGKIEIIRELVKHSRLTNSEKEKLLDIVKERVSRLNIKY